MDPLNIVLCHSAAFALAHNVAARQAKVISTAAEELGIPCTITIPQMMATIKLPPNTILICFNNFPFLKKEMYKMLVDRFEEATAFVFLSDDPVHAPPMSQMTKARLGRVNNFIISHFQDILANNTERKSFSWFGKEFYVDMNSVAYEPIFPATPREDRKKGIIYWGYWKSWREKSFSSWLDAPTDMYKVWISTGSHHEEKFDFVCPLANVFPTQLNIPIDLQNFLGTLYIEDSVKDMNQGVTNRFYEALSAQTLVLVPEEFRNRNFDNRIDPYIVKDHNEVREKLETLKGSDQREIFHADYKRRVISQYKEAFKEIISCLHKN